MGFIQSLVIAQNAPLSYACPIRAVLGVSKIYPPCCWLSNMQNKVAFRRHVWIHNARTGLKSLFRSCWYQTMLFRVEKWQCTCNVSKFDHCRHKPPLLYTQIWSGSVIWACNMKLCHVAKGKSWKNFFLWFLATFFFLLEDQ